MNRSHSTFVFQVQTPTASTLEDLQRVFPQYIHIKADGPDMTLEIIDPTIASVDLALFRVQCECDRIRFVTGEDLNPRFVREVLPDGTKRNERSIFAAARIIKPLPPSMGPQNWTARLATQLRLWFLAKEPSTHVLLRINLFFQIIECSFPLTNVSDQYPEYKEEGQDPHPRTECKLLRHLATHGVGKPVKGSELICYCRKHKLQGFADPTDQKVMTFLASKLLLLEHEARAIVEQQIL